MLLVLLDTERSSGAEAKRLSVEAVYSPFTVQARLKTLALEAIQETIEVQT